MAIHFDETRETIDLLRRVLDKLDENDGCISGEDLWYGLNCVPSNVRSSNPSVARHGMRQMEALLDGLQSFAATLVSTYKSHIDTTRLCVRTPRLTVESLPNEIIYNIVNDAFYELESSEASLIKYSHICSKFRDVILNSPSLWALIPLYPGIPTNLIQTIIRRSGTLGLNVNIHITGDWSGYGSDWKLPLHSSSALSGLSAMFKQNHRWRNLLLMLHEDESANIVLKHFPSANFTSVRDLDVHTSDKGSETDFFKKWTFPRLEVLRWSSAKVSPPLGMASQTLHRCILSLGQGALNLMTIATFLNAASGLRALVLFLHFPDNDEPAEFQEIRLPYLEVLNVHSWDGPRLISDAPFLKSILCPSLKHLDLIASTPAEYLDLTEHMRERYPVLTSLELRLADSDVKQVFTFEDILCSLPSSIKSLKIELIIGDRATLYASQRDNNVPRNLCVSYPNLTDLDFVNGWRWDVNMLEEDFYAKLSQLLKRFRVSLNHFGPGVGGRENAIEQELDEKNAIMTLQRAGVLSVAELTLTS